MTPKLLLNPIRCGAMLDKKQHKDIHMHKPTVVSLHRQEGWKHAASQRIFLF